MPADSDEPLFACRCLNIRFLVGKDAKPQSDIPAEYVSLFVADEGIKISHNELTLRTRSPVVDDSTSSTGRSQQTLVTCLICETAAYRVKTDIPLDEDAKEGPILPSEDWAERDTLRSKSGYVEVHVGRGGCISGDEIEQLSSSTSYSKQFSLNLPSDSHLLPTSAPPVLPHARLTIPAAEHSFLPNLQPFLQPPPFTPSHPIFLHLASIITACSNDARRDSEKRIEVFVRQELARLEEHETSLRTQLEHLWWIVKERLKKAEEDRDMNFLSALQSRRRSMSPRRSQLSGSGGVESVVRNFVPSNHHAPRAIHTPAPQPSALSASLATSSFHHPRAQQTATSQQPNLNVHQALTPSPPPYTSNTSSSEGSAESEARSIATPSRSFKRNMDASNDIAITYRYFVIEEQEAARRKAKERAKEQNVPVNGTEGDGQKSSEMTSKKAEDQQEVASRAEAKTKIPVNGDKLISPKKKGGRKVTFNVEPNVVTIRRNNTSERKEERVPEKGEDLLFDMDVVDSRSAPAQVEDSRTGEHKTDAEIAGVVTNEEPGQIIRSSKRYKATKVSGLPQSFAALRPASLPAPSHIRPPIPVRSRDEQASEAPSTDAVQGTSRRGRENTLPPEGAVSNEVLSPEQKDILKLVAAETPSHRGFWRPGSKAWKIFESRRTASSSDDELTDDPDSSDVKGTNTESTDAEWRNYSRPDIAGSLPIPMAPISSQGKPLSISSFQPRTSLTDHRDTLVPPLPTVAEEEEGREKKTPTAIRKEIYAERNKARGLDPGVLDFADGDGNETDSPEQDANQVSMSRSRQHALNIIKARNSVPPEGLWRSLAT